MKEEKYYRRISINVSQELYDRLNRTFEWGERTRIVTRVLEWLCEKVEKHGTSALVVLLREEEFQKLVDLQLSEASKNGHNR